MPCQSAHIQGSIPKPVKRFAIREDLLGERCEDCPRWRRRSHHYQGKKAKEIQEEIRKKAVHAKEREREAIETELEEKC